MEYIRKCIIILDKKQKLNFFLVAFLNFFITLLELLGISIIFPVISILIDPSIVYKYSENTFFSFIIDYSHSKLIIISLSITIIFYFLKTIVITLITYFKTQRMYVISASLSQSMFYGYINQSLSFLIPKNSAYVTRNIIDFPSLYVNNILVGLFTVFFELIFIFGIFIIFIKLNFNIGLIISILSIAFIFLYNFFNLKNLSIYGKSLNDRYSLRMKTAREAIEGIKEIGLYNKQDYFNKIYSQDNFRIVSLSTLFEIRQILPKFLLEFLAVVFISSSIIFLLNKGYEPSEIFPVISVLAAGLIKAIPSISKILSSMQRIKSNEHVVNTIYEEIAKFKKILINTNSLKDFNKEIIIKNLSFKYPSSNIIIKDLNFKIKKNTIFGIKGKSGSGKSTLLNLISGFLNPTSGAILVDGVNIQENVSNWQKNIAYIPQKVFISDNNIKQNICFGVHQNNIDENLLIEVIKIAKIDEFIDINNGGLNKILGERGSNISSGQIQRIGLARALYTKPNILILDESTSALDKSTEEKILDDILKLKSKITILFVSHSDKVISLCDDFYNLEK